MKTTARQKFIHRHDRIKPTYGNILLLGFAVGCAFVSIVFSLCSHFTK